MTLARVTTWVDSNVLTAGALNAEFDNLINNAPSLISPLTGPVNFSSQIVSNLVPGPFQSSDPAAVGFVEGKLSYYSGEGLLIVNTGVTTSNAAVVLGPGSGISATKGLQGSLISNIGSFSAVSYQLQRLNTNIPTLSAVTATSSFSVNTQTAGPIAGGRDQLAAFASTTVHFYMLTTGYKSTAPMGVVSSNPPPTGPTLFGANSNWVYLCSAIYTPASSVMAKSALISGSYVTLSTYETVLTSGASTSLSTGIPLGSIVPQIAPLIQMSISRAGGIPANSGGLDAGHQVYVTSSLAAGQQAFEAFSVYSESSMTWRGTHLSFRIPNINTPPAVAYRNTINTGTSASMTLLVTGYIVPNGDVG